jgi:tight adherence protein C
VDGAAAIAALSALLVVGALAETMTLVAARRARRAAEARGQRTVALLARIGRRLGSPAAPRDLPARLAAAGAPFGLQPADVMAAKGGATALALAVSLFLGGVMPGRLGIVLPFIFGAGAFLAPDVWLRRRARNRAREMERELPDLLDLLRIALGAGLSLERAIGDAARHEHGMLAREWGTVAAEVGLGVPLATALAGLRARCAAPGVAALVRALDRAARHGAPLAETLAAQAREARAAHARRLNEQAARAAPKIQLVVALLLVPSVLLLVAASMLAVFMG